MQRTRYFTPAQANALVPDVAARMREVAGRIRQMRHICEVAGLPGLDPDDAAAQISHLKRAIESAIDEICSEGVEVKGVEPALVDFPALMNGHEVYLCWREGEDGVGWWHPVRTGFSDRVPLDPEESGAFEWEN